MKIRIIITESFIIDTDDLREFNNIEEILLLPKDQGIINVLNSDISLRTTAMDHEQFRMLQPIRLAKTFGVFDDSQSTVHAMAYRSKKSGG